MATPAPTLDTRRPFTRAQARAAGISAHALRGTAFTRILHDVYISAEIPVTSDLRASVALELCPGSALSHHTAARRYGVWAPDDADIHVSVRRRQDRRKRRGLVTHLAHPMAEVVLHRGMPMSSPQQVFCEMARFLGLVDLVVVGDSLVRRGLVTPVELIRAASRWRGHRAVLARRAAGYVRTGVDSPMETRLRMLLVLAGLPEPTVAHEIPRPDGRRRIRFDLCWPGVRVAVEYDGRQHAGSTDQWLHDIGRREDLDVLRWRLVIVTAEGIYVEPEVTLQRVVAALADAGRTHVRIAADDEWRRHFPGRPRAA